MLHLFVFLLVADRFALDQGVARGLCQENFKGMQDATLFELEARDPLFVRQILAQLAN